MSTCTNCGLCCTPCLQVTQEEINNIKTYINQNNIQELIYEKDGRLEFICPFRDQVNRVCTIYPVRPEVCALFESWNPNLYGLEGHIQRIVDNSVETGKGAHKIFFDNDWFLTRYKNENQ